MAKQAGPIENNKAMAYGGLMRFGQQMIHQASIAVDCFFHPFDGNKSQNGLLHGVEDIPTGAILFTKVERNGPIGQANKKRRLMEHTRTMSASTRRQPKVFCNVRWVTDYGEIVFAGVSDTEITIRNDDWRYRTGASVIPVISGTRTVMNTGPDDIYEGEWVYYETPGLSKKSDGSSPHDDFKNNKEFDCHRAVLRPVTAANYAVDPDCIYRTVGKCVAFSRAGQMLDLSISSAVAPIPFGAANPRATYYSAAAGPVPPKVAATALFTTPLANDKMKFSTGDEFKFKLMSNGKDFMVFKVDDTPLTANQIVAALPSTKGLALENVWNDDVKVPAVGSFKLRISFDGTKPELQLHRDDPVVLRTQAHRGPGQYGVRHQSQSAQPRRTFSGLQSSPAAAAAAAAAAAGAAASRHAELEPDQEEEDEDAEDDEDDDTVTLSSSSSSTADR